MERYTYSGQDYDPDKNLRNSDNRSAATDRQAPSQRRERPQRRRDNADQAPGFFSKTIAFFTNRRTRAVIGIAIIVLACYLAIAALSFVKNSAGDQSAISGESVSQMVEQGTTVQNMGGPVGAKISNHLFVEGLGYGSVVLIVYMVLVGLSLLGVRKSNFWSLTFKSLILAITLSFVLGLLTINSSATIPPGGYHGHYINQLLIDSVGWIGALLVNGLLIVIVVTVFLTELLSFYNKYRVKMRTLRDRRIMENDRKREEEETVKRAMSNSPIDSEQPEDAQPQPAQSEATQVGRFEMPISLDNSLDDYHPANDDDSRMGNTASDVATASVAAAAAATTIASPAVDATEEASTPTATMSNETTTTTPQSQGSTDPGFTVKGADDIEQGDSKSTDIKVEGRYDPKAELSRYRMPSTDLLIDRPRKLNSVDLTEQQENKERITKTLNDYGIQIQQIEATVGPTVTLYEIVPAQGVRIARIKNLEDDIALSLAALGIRIIAPIPGKGTIGIEVPNKDPQTVSIRSILGSRAFQETKCELPMALGATISNKVFIADLTKMPHLLVAGATGQGKSVGLNTIIASLLYKRHPAELKFVLVDPKMVEFSLYSRLEKHYLAKLPDALEPVVTDPAKVVDTLNSLCIEMDNRYALLKDAGCRSLLEYNEKFINRRLNPEKGHRYMPYIVVIVDEFADLIMTSGKAIETPIARIAQKARAVGMHMIIATQRPSTNVITGIIKANFPARIAFRVSQANDSRIILDGSGANQLIGRGDMLISVNNSVERVQCAFIDTPEVEAICQHIDNQIGFESAYILPEPPSENADGPTGSISDRDTLFDEAARWVVQGNTASTSMLQRRYSIGYNRAGKIMDQMEVAGIVGATQGGKPRQVLVDPTQLEIILSSL